MTIIGLRIALLPCLTACLATFSALSASLVALEQVGDPPKYLTEKFRADWRMKPLKGVLDELGNFLEKPLVRSASVNALGEDRLIALVANKKITLRETLELLERSQDLHFTAETLRLRVETWEDFRDRKRHPVNLSLRDYAVFSSVPDFPAPNFGYVGRGGDGNGGDVFSLFKADANSHASGREPDASAVVDWLQKISSNGGLELRGHGNVFVLATDEEEAAMRKALLDVHAQATQGSGWRVTFGTLPANETFTAGIVPTADAAKLAARLQNRDAVTLQAINGQRVNAASRRQQAYLGDLDVINAKYDPAISVLNTGHSADLRPTIGMNFTLLSFQLAWVEPVETTTVEALHPGHVDAGSTTSTTTNEKEKDKDKDAAKTVSVTHEPGTTHGGEQVKISKPTVWSWQPRGECYLAKGSALIFAAEHAAGRALIIVQETP